jgi:hypothetical protein
MLSNPIWDTACLLLQQTLHFPMLVICFILLTLFCQDIIPVEGLKLGDVKADWS